jgi:hypothetical protein
VPLSPSIIPKRNAKTQRPGCYGWHQTTPPPANWEPKPVGEAPSRAEGRSVPLTEKETALSSPKPGGVGARPAARLGRYAKSTSTSENNQPEPSSQELSAALTTERYLLQSGARALLPGERVAGCLRWRQGGKDCVEVWHLQELQRARFGNLQTCASVWMCPVCAAKITERRKQELTAALIAAQQQGLSVVMVTYTLRHKSSDRLSWLLGGQARGSRKNGTYQPPTGLMGARGVATGGRAAKTLREECGVVGSIRSLELTWGQESGWHPHIHELLFVETKQHLERLEIGLRQQWETGLRLAGMREVNQHGLDFTTCNIEIAAYIEKMGRERSWNIEHELTKQPVKKGREGRFTPTELLRAFTLDGDAAAGELWREYALTLKGSRQLYWSKGLRPLLLPAVPDRTDQEVAEEVEQAGTLLAELDLKLWRTILHHEARAQVLNIAALGDPVALWAFLSSLEPDPARSRQRDRNTSPSRKDSHRSLPDLEEAHDLGLSYVQYRLWKRGGINAIADLAAPEHTQTAGAWGPSRPGRRKEVIPCDEQEPLLTFIT